MPTILTKSGGTVTITPLAVSDYSAEQTGGAIVHPILGRENQPDVTYRPMGPRSGSFTLTFSTEAETETARQALTGSGAWMLDSAERATVNMRFVPRSVSRTLNGDGHWALLIGYQETP